MAGVMTSEEESCDEYHDFPNLPNAYVILYGPVKASTLVSVNPLDKWVYHFA
jgi:hypothetical protein